jgi:hypothetical protein
LHDELVARNAADLLLFDEVAVAFAASLPAAAAERDCIREVADAAAELTRHRDPKTIAVAAASTAKTPTDHHVFFRPEPVLGWWPEPNATSPLPRRPGKPEHQHEGVIRPPSGRRVRLRHGLRFGEAVKTLVLPSDCL